MGVVLAPASFVNLNLTANQIFIQAFNMSPGSGVWSGLGGGAEVTERAILGPYSIGSTLYHKPFVFVPNHDGSWESGDEIVIHFGDWMEPLAGDTDVKVELVAGMD